MFFASAIETGDGRVFIYTAVVENERKEIIQRQCLAIGDRICYEKVKDKPVVPVSLLPDWLSGADFRDPEVEGIGNLLYGSRLWK